MAGNIKYKHQKSIKNPDSDKGIMNQVWILLLILGILMAIIYLVLIFIDGTKLKYYIFNCIFGLFITIYSFYEIKKKV